MTPPLEARGLTRRYGRFEALHEVSLALDPGALTIVVGPNGAGKTTLLRLLAGTLRPDRGEVRLEGKPLEDRSPREIATRLAVVPQQLFVPFPFRVREMVAMGRAPHLGALGREGAGDHAIVAAALKAQGLVEFAERRWDSLSAGEQQRVLLARALAQRPRVMLLDEPTSHMDLGRRLETFERLQAWTHETDEGSGEARVALLVTHDLDMAARFADCVVMLDRGRLVAAGPPAGVLTAQLVARVYGVEADVSLDVDGRPLVVARRARIEYIGAPHEQDPHDPGP